MEYREPPRIAATERRLDGVIDDANPRSRLRRFQFVRAERHLDSPRLVRAILLVTAAVAIIGYLGIQLLRSAIDWLHHQPQYQLRFLDIELMGPPPGWFRGGTEGFLRQVRENAKETEVLELMELERDRIANDFKLYPWVEDVRRVEYPPQSIRVHLVYKTPVAKIPIPPSGAAYIDRKGFLLPVEDIDMEQLGPLILVTGEGLEQASPDNRPGLAWRSSAPGAEAARLENCVKKAASLAGFLQEPERVKEAAESKSLLIIRIHLPTDDRGLWLETFEGAIIRWGATPGEESPGSLEAMEKWKILGTWAKTPTRRTLPRGDYWTFSKSELIPMETDHRR